MTNRWFYSDKSAYFITTLTAHLRSHWVKVPPSHEGGRFYVDESTGFTDFSMQDCEICCKSTDFHEYIVNLIWYRDQDFKTKSQIKQNAKNLCKSPRNCHVWRVSKKKFKNELEGALANHYFQHSNQDRHGCCHQGQAWVRQRWWRLQVRLDLSIGPTGAKTLLTWAWWNKTETVNRHSLAT